MLVKKKRSQVWEMGCWEMLKLQQKKLKKPSATEGQGNCLLPEYQFNIMMRELSRSLVEFKALSKWSRQVLPPSNKETQIR